LLCYTVGIHTDGVRTFEKDLNDAWYRRLQVAGKDQNGVEYEP